MARDILFIAPSAYPLGGVATWLSYIIPGLRERGWNVTLGLVEGRFHNVEAYLAVHPDDQVLQIPSGTGTREGRVRQLVRAIRGTRPEIVVAVHIVDVILAIDRIRAMSEWPLRAALSLHAMQADFIGSIRKYAGVLDAIFCTNQLACDLVARLTPVAPSRIYYATCGVDVNAPKERRAPDDILSIAYVGRLERAEKRIEDLRDIIAELDRRGVAYHFFIAGGGPDEEWLRVQLSDATSDDRVQFLGTLARANLPKQVYSRVNAVLIPSERETGPIVAWEAMANGAAVVTSAYIGSGLEGSLQPGENCLMFPIGDATAAVDCLEKLRDTELRSRLCKRGHDLVASRYSTTVSIDQWSAALSQVAIKPALSGSRLADMAFPAGRLDRLFGQSVGETIRALLSIKSNHSEPGAEWPHANGYSAVDEEAFWQLAISLDRRKSSPRD